MDKSDVDKLVNRWMNEPDFRKKMKENPEETIKASGIRLDEQDKKALQGIDWKLPDEELQKRASNFFS